MIVSGEKGHAADYIEGLGILSSMRLCANVPGQTAIQTALGGQQSIEQLVLPTGRLGRQRDVAWQLLKEIPGVSCVKPRAALYLFPRLDREVHKIVDDQRMCIDLREPQHVLLTHGTGFNLPSTDHIRVVFLAPVEVLSDAITRLGEFLATYRQ